MLFNSIQFFVFFAIVMALYSNLDHRRQNWLLVAASYVFYGWWDWRFTILMLASTLIDFTCAARIAASEDATVRKRWVTASVVTHLAILGVFKYFDFFVDTAVSLVTAAGWTTHVSGLHLVLPVALSFYTFKSMGYTIDVYRRVSAPARRFDDFALFVSFFPQLVAGPIERARHLLPQVTHPRQPLRDTDVKLAVYLIAWGLFKKVIVGDGCAHLANTVFDNEMTFSGADHWIALYAFTVQIYADFSGYSDMAVGVARLLGFDLIENFRLPYFATSPSDLWRRWHISLSSWLRDYLYIPLGGNRHGSAATYRNLLITMALGGLWHGARWTMVCWGVYHGLGLCAQRAFASGRQGAVPLYVGANRWRWPKILATFHFTAFGWLLFRADSLSQVGRMLGGMFGHPYPTAWTGPALITLVELTLVLALYELAQFRRGQVRLFFVWRPVFRVAFTLAVTYSALLYWLLHRSLVAGSQPFIYFQF